MELIPYNETRNYGKKVLANYIIYKNLLKEPIKVQKVLDKALVP
jgi:soluble lytic murein transglycosylase